MASNSNRFKMSQERLDEIKQELQYLETVREKEVADLIKEARSFGDLSENSEYDEAKAEQGKLYSKIAELKVLQYRARTRRGGRFCGDLRDRRQPGGQSQGRPDF